MAQEQSMFGPSASQIDRGQQMQDLAQFSQATPLGIAAWGGGMAGTALGRMAGLENPEIRKANKLQEVKDELAQEGLDASKPDEFYPRLIAKLNEKGLTEQAMSAANAYRSQSLEGSLKSSQIAEHIAKATSLGKENESPIARLQREYSTAIAKGNLKVADQLQTQIDKLNSLDAKATMRTEKGNLPLLERNGKLFIPNKDGTETPYDPNIHGGVEGINGVKVNSSLDLAVDKLFTIYQKPRCRDFIDLFYDLSKI